MNISHRYGWFGHPKIEYLSPWIPNVSRRVHRILWTFWFISKDGLWRSVGSTATQCRQEFLCVVFMTFRLVLLPLPICSPVCPLQTFALESTVQRLKHLLRCMVNIPTQKHCSPIFTCLWTQAADLHRRLHVGSNSHVALGWFGQREVLQEIRGHEGKQVGEYFLYSLPASAFQLQKWLQPVSSHSLLGCS